MEVIVHKQGSILWIKKNYFSAGSSELGRSLCASWLPAFALLSVKPCESSTLPLSTVAYKHSSQWFVALRLQLLQDRFLAQDLWLSRAVACHLTKTFRCGHWTPSFNTSVVWRKITLHSNKYKLKMFANFCTQKRKSKLIALKISIIYVRAASLRS